MDLAARLGELQKRVEQHKEVLLTEEAAKTALVMPFIQALGYDVFNPSEVVPEFTADVGVKKGEKVDYAIIGDGKVSILIECKPASVQLDISHASQLFRYFSCTDARLAVLTNGVVYDFYSDVDRPNKMDDRPFFSFNLGAIKPQDLKTLESFGKATFDIGHIVQEAGNLKIQNLLRKELAKEFAQPSDEFIKMFAARVHTGNITQVIKDRFAKLVLDAVNGFVRELVNDRLSQALKASAPADETEETPQVSGGGNSGLWDLHPEADADRLERRTKHEGHKGGFAATRRTRRLSPCPSSLLRDLRVYRPSAGSAGGSG